MPFDKTKWARLSKNHFLCPQDFFGKKYPFEIFKVFLSFLYFERNVLRLSVDRSCNACENMILRILNINFPVKFKINWKIPKMFIFLVSTAKNSLQKNFSRLVKSVPILSTVTFWGKVIFLKIWFLSLWDFGLIFLCPMLKQTQRGCPNEF